MKNLRLLLLILSISFLTACGGGGGSDNPVRPAVNVAPVASAGANQSVMTNAVVTLDASASSDANGDALTYAWTLTAKPAGSAATLSSSTAVKPTFTADIAGTYVASLVVNDGKVNSNTTSVTVTASVANAAPVANARSAQSVLTGTLVTLDGSASADANGDPLTYAWSLTSKPAGSTATLSSSAAAKPTFTADIAGTFVATLVVNDGKVDSTAKTVAITAVTDLSQLFSTKQFSDSASCINFYCQYGRTFSIANESNETFALNKYVVSANGAVIQTTTDPALLSGGQLTPGETLEVSVTATRPFVGLGCVYYLTLTRTGQSFTVSYTW